MLNTKKKNVFLRVSSSGLDLLNKKKLVRHFVILNIRSENFIFTKNCTVITTFKYDNLFDEMIGY